MRITGFVLTLVYVALSASALEFPGPEPGAAGMKGDGAALTVFNAILSQTWSTKDGALKPVRVTDRMADETIDLQGTEVFRLTLGDGRTIAASELAIDGKPTTTALDSNPEAFTLAERSGGQQLSVRLKTKDGTLRVDWRTVLRDGANVIRQEISLNALGQAIPVKQIVLVELPGQETRVMGSVTGSPMVRGNLFFAYEHPNSECGIGKWAVDAPFRALASLSGDFTLQPGKPFAQTAAFGVVPEGQLRRGFLYYIERSRAHPYRPFLHYNAWYDICWAKRKITEEECLDAVELFGRELTEKRGVTLDSFVWDDGWDDPKTLWRVLETNFPNGFSKVLQAAQKYNSTLGFWLSPFGGYGQPAKDRWAYGQQQGFEFKQDRFSLAGPKYYARFYETCARFITENGSNFYKFDGLTRDIAETEAMLRLTRDLRALKRDLYISITTGTWPTPYWLWYGDNIWRGGRDMGWAGEGTKREQWITYRDMDTYRGVVLKGPLYPLNSLMTQGIAHARFGYAEEVSDEPAEMRREIRSFFASGTNLQELYITPSMMSAENWDDLAEAATWARGSADVLVDTHWLGGDPGAGEVYGWTSWSKRKGVLALRNPGTKRQAITLDIDEVFELPTGAATGYTLKSPWKDEAKLPAFEMQAGSKRTFELDPFQVLVFDATPRR